MIKTTKRIVAILLVVVMAISCFPIAAFAATEYIEGDYTYTVSDSKATIVSYPETAEGIVNIPGTLGGYPVTAIGAYAFYGCTLITEIGIPASVTSIGNNAFNYCIYLKVVNFGGTEAQWNKILIGSGNSCLTNTTIYYSINDIYNLGEETYSFENFGDTDSTGGHCFGMSTTSAGYYNNILDITNVGGNVRDDVYGLLDNSAVREPICYYQAIQGSYSVGACVAGGSVYLTGKSNIRSDWEEVIEYVENHKYDDMGTLQIGFRQGSGGHAINFLRYEVVNGQQRIYAYDNNFPDIETYFYRTSSGNILQAPQSTFSGPIDCIALRDINIYFELAGNYDATRYIYGDSKEIEISGAVAYPMECGNSSYTMFEIPDEVEQVVITPLVDNARFYYVDEEYSFDSVSDDTVGIFKLASYNDDTLTTPIFTITNIDFEIQSPTRNEIRNKDGIILHANVEDAPAGSYVVWSSSNRKFDTDDLGNGNYKIIANNKGWTTFIATLYDIDGNILGTDTVEMYSKSGFFDKIGGFFRSLFGTTKIYDN